MEMLVGCVVVWLVFALFGSWIASAKGRDGPEGFFLGLLFGPLGCLIEALLPNISAEKVRADAERARIEYHDQIKRMQAAREASRQHNEMMMNDLRAAGVWTARMIFVPFRAARSTAIRLSPWFHETIIRFGWYKSLPEIAQPIVIGLGVSLPLVAVLVVILRSR